MTINRSAFQFLRVYFWVCIAFIAIYVIFSVVFFMLGREQFASFQSLVASNPLTYVVAGSAILSFITSPFMVVEDE